MPTDTSVTSCSCVLWSIVHHIGNTVEGFTLYALCFLTFSTQSLFLCLAECCGFIGNTSAFCFCIHSSAVGSTGNLLPNVQFLLCRINRRLAFFLGSNLLGNGSTAFRLGFLQFFQSCLFVGNHSIGYGLCHSLIALCLLNDSVPSGIAVGLLIKGIALHILWYSLHCRNILRGNVAIFGNIFATIVTLILGRLLDYHSVMLHQHTVEFITSEQVYTLAIDRCFGVNLISSVCICIGSNVATNSISVLITEGNKVVEGILRSAFFLNSLLIGCILGSSLLLELRHTCQLCRLCLLLYGLLGQGEHVCTVRHIYSAVPIIHNTLIVGYNLHLYLCIIACNGVCVARIECNNTINPVGCLLCVLLTDSICGSLHFSYGV